MEIQKNLLGDGYFPKSVSCDSEMDAALKLMVPAIYIQTPEKETKISDAIQKVKNDQKIW